MNHMFMWGKSILCDKCARAPVKKKSSAHAHSYLMLISLFYLFMYYVCMSDCYHIFKSSNASKKMLLKKKVVCMHIRI